MAFSKSLFVGWESPPTASPKWDLPKSMWRNPAQDMFIPGTDCNSAYIMESGSLCFSAVVSRRVRVLKVRCWLQVVSLGSRPTGDKVLGLGWKTGNWADLRGLCPSVPLRDFRRNRSVPLDSDHGKPKKNPFGFGGPF